MDLTSISNAYMSGKPTGDTSMKTNALREIEDKIIKGNVHSIAGVLHLLGHWTSLIVEFGSPRIIFGDSLRNKMPPPQARSFKQWIIHMLHRSERNILTSDIPILPLETSILIHVASFQSMLLGTTTFHGTFPSWGLISYH